MAKHRKHQADYQPPYKATINHAARRHSANSLARKLRSEDSLFTNPSLFKLGNALRPVSEHDLQSSPGIKRKVHASSNQQSSVFKLLQLLVEQNKIISAACNIVTYSQSHSLTVSHSLSRVIVVIHTYIRITHNHTHTNTSGSQLQYVAMLCQYDL